MMICFQVYVLFGLIQQKITTVYRDLGITLAKQKLRYVEYASRWKQIVMQNL